MTDLLTLAEARTALGWKPGTMTENDADLSALYIPAVTRAIEKRCGRMADRRESWRTDDPSPLTTPWSAATVKSVAINGETTTGYTFSAPTLTITDADYVSGDEVTVIVGGLPTPSEVYLVARRVLRRTWNADHPQTGGNNARQQPATPAARAVLTAEDLADLADYVQLGSFA